MEEALLAEAEEDSFPLTKLGASHGAAWGLLPAAVQPPGHTQLTLLGVSPEAWKHCQGCCVCKTPW